MTDFTDEYNPFNQQDQILIRLTSFSGTLRSHLQSVSNASSLKIFQDDQAIVA